ncbi:MULTISPECIES: hypothetical protein [unclassified Salinivibrio]|uniref:hypothetical protein n=1 Tax=unclassified Salinivibrio TaxID=2636825 RepID=UPI00128C76AD|nr:MULTISPECIES: hypothetical protein [unclassified Salinivibrio]MPS33660.1 hypothetical protein [Salinivibrio sp. VYel7]MPX95043.1 hypothetical protein [Salinivibrio sp. VYel9]MPX96846.1 hypothetical protein [Salinivibrio sp. VYel6]MPX99733.1 hypothetical protein [Salinivibrio sp. VYel4]MPY04315.1 hypothetical protein [Salinivibrio sp. VYel5]
MRNLVVILSLLMLVACGEEETAENIQKKLEQGETLTKKQQCIADTVVSSIVDPKNVMLFAATFDVLSRAYIAQKAQIVNYCSTMIVGSRQSDAFKDYSENCPEELKELSNEQLTELDIRAQELARLAADLDGSPLDAALGSCVDF